MSIDESEDPIRCSQLPLRVHQAIYDATLLVPPQLVKNVEQHDRGFVSQLLRGFPLDLQLLFITNYHKQSSRREQNTWLRKCIPHITNKLDTPPPSPAGGQTHLRKIWAQTRSSLHRQQLQPYGFRIGEPQHCGSPHWHMLLFVTTL
ncbi:replication endonuclease [Ferrimonas lipolytica]|uniref:Replication endonuclease n=1 Tax=Ferrimonas lipolytica TaxID=2724191 RepID=A0A6H1UDZ5_9GAMM|nr:replication endonuclease [Ferrimonas lipolytica]